MGNDVFANGREVSCKAADGKSICAFPDVCMTPPENPATPPGVPIPYPNTGMASDMTSGSKNVKISNKEVILKNKSYFKKSTGDEAGCAAKKGVVTSKIQGKVYFNSWSMDVKFEGENVVRHLDLTTHNHASPPTNTVPWIYQDMTAFGNPPECKEDTKRMQEACKDSKSKPVRSKPRKKHGKVRIRWHHVECSPECKEAMDCILVPKKLDKEMCCRTDGSSDERGNTGHHMIENHWVKGKPGFPMANTHSGYQGAPCLCVNRKRSEGNHQAMHNIQGVYEESFLPGGARHVAGHPSDGFTYGEGKKAALNAHDATCGESGCSEGCIEAQIESYYNPDNKPNSDDRPLNKSKKGSKQPLGEEPRADTLESWGHSISASA